MSGIRERSFQVGTVSLSYPELLPGSDDRREICWRTHDVSHWLCTYTWCKPASTVTMPNSQALIDADGSVGALIGGAHATAGPFRSGNTPANPPVPGGFVTGNRQKTPSDTCTCRQRTKEFTGGIWRENFSFPPFGSSGVQAKTCLRKLRIPLAMNKNNFPYLTFRSHNYLAG